MGRNLSETRLIARIFLNPAGDGRAMNMRAFSALRPESACISGGAGRVVAVVVTHDRLEQLRCTVTSLLRTPPAQLAALVVVDNGSTDGTEAWLAGLRDPRLQVLRCAQNRGGAGGFAAGIAYAQQACAPDWVLVMDDDARPCPGTLAAFHAADLGGWDAVAGAVYLPQGGVCEMNRPSHDPFRDWRVALATALRGRAGFHLDTRHYGGTAPVRVDAASYVGLFLSRRALRLAGLPDASLFLYADDMLHTLRLTRAGGRIGFFPALRFEHACEGEGGRVPPLWKLYFRYRNSLMLYRVAAGRLFGLVCLVVLPVWTLRALRRRGQRAAALRLLAGAVMDGLQGRTDRAVARVGRGAAGGSQVPEASHRRSGWT